MKITKTDFSIKVNEGSSWKAYVCKNQEMAMNIHSLMMTAGTNEKGNYWHVSTFHGADCRIPDFFQDTDYWFTVVEHNNGNWNNESTYELYLVS